MAKGAYDPTRTGNPYVDGVLSGWHWDSNTLRYTFPQSPSAYPVNYGGYYEPLFDFSPVSEQAQQAMREFIHGAQAGSSPWMTLTPIEGFSNLTLVETTSTYRDTEIMIAHSSKGNPTAHAYYPMPYNEHRAGDVWFGTSIDYNFMRRNPLIGTWGYKSAMHELGHALGLKHGHDRDELEDVALPLDKDFIEYSVMSYNYAPKVEPSSLVAADNWRFFYPQTYMMLDIAGLQRMYGANFTFRATDTVYTWDPDTGETFVNGVGQGLPGGGIVMGPDANRILQTIWDGNGIDTYDLSNYTTNLSINLEPGKYSTFSEAQRTWLGYLNDEYYYARGNVYNAMLYSGDTRSLIENATGGSGDDTIKGNQAGNYLIGNGGIDTLEGGAGDDTLDGGAGADTAVFSGLKSDYTIVENSDGTFTVTDNRADGDGTDKLISIRYAKFSDQRIALQPNHAPTAIDLSNKKVAENIEVGKEVGILSGTDPDEDPLTYRLTSDPGNYFRIEGNKLIVAKPLDYETLKEHTITIEGKDAGGLATTKTFTIEVTNVVEGRPPAILLISVKNLAKSTPVGSVIGEVFGWDPDGDSLTYQVTFDGYGSFSLKGNQIILEKALDNLSMKQIYIRATDVEGLSIERGFDIKIIDDGVGNRAPAFLSISCENIARSTPVGTVIGEVAGYDPDGDSLAYTMTVDGDGYFGLSGNKIVLKKALDASITTKEISIRATDVGDLSLEKNFQINVIGNVAENRAPTILLISSEKIARSTPVGTVIGEVAGYDPDGDSLTYTMTADGDGYFGLNGNKIVLKKAVDTSITTKEISIRATDVGDLSLEKSFQIDVVDGVVENRAPTILLISCENIARSTPVGTVIGEVAGYDPDGDRLTYTMTLDADGYFGLSGNKIVLKKALDTSTGAKAIGIRATDVGRLSLEKRFEINVLDDHGSTPPTFPPTSPPTTPPSIPSLTLRGTTKADTLIGGMGDDTIYGRQGNDVLVGSAGKDIFVFDTKPNAKTNVDIIIDFNVKIDSIWLDRAVFKKLGKGPAAELNKKFFTVGGKAKDKDDYVFYNKSTGTLSYDADGSGAGKAIEIAKLSKGLKLTYADFFVV
ncbi:cadherin domain-containing protein [Microvirga alba]|uniref:Cadherin domain-containing protein n=1 Tax=Microvirga alba TaxID=2791025 RepID=A0A931BRY8_9HYPH|nr:cadherin domain-containing protein [Microvirga alba]MBF9234928.1 cadherin domain-containing protein [Microvirga alba]